jgi:hypothetical protein
MEALRRSWLAVVAASLTVAVAAAPLGDVPSKEYRHKTYKFSLKVFANWDEVPVEPSEAKYTAAKFFEPGNKGDWYRPELEVLRLDKRENGGQGPTTGNDPVDPNDLRKKIEQAYEEANRPKSVFDLCFGRNKSLKLDPESFKKTKSADGLEGKMWVVSIGPGGAPPKDAKGKEKEKEKAVDRANSQFAGLVAYEKEGVEYGIFLTGPDRRHDDFELALKTMAKSFLYFDEKAKDVQSIKVLDGVNISAKRRSEIEKGLVQGWAVEVSPKKNYVIVYNTKKDKNRPLARTLASRIEKIREQVYEVQFPPAQPVTAVSIVRVCADRNEYFAYGGPGGSAGYWNDRSEELVFYDASPRQDADDDTLAVLYHEAFHQYIYYSVGNVAPHSWFNEGHGDYYAGSRYTPGSGKFRIGPFGWRIATVQAAIQQGPRTFNVVEDPKTGKAHNEYTGTKGYTPLRDLVAFTQGQYYSYPGVSYAQGWSLIYFLREGVPKKKEWNEKWGKILDKYFAALKREVAKEGRMRRGGLEDPPAPPSPPTKPDDPTSKKPPSEPPAPSPTAPDEPKKPDDPDHPKTPPTDGPDAPKEPKEPKEPKDGGDGGAKPGGPGDEGEPQDPGFQPMQRGEASESALEIALREAFDGVNFDELEKAWIEFTKKVHQGS